MVLLWFLFTIQIRGFTLQTFFIGKATIVHDAVQCCAVFKTTAIDHSAIAPDYLIDCH